MEDIELIRLLESKKRGLEDLRTIGYGIPLPVKEKLYKAELEILGAIDYVEGR